MKKVLAAFLAAAMSLSLVACGSSNTGDSASTDNKAQDNKTYKIGICQLVQHEALDAATQGFEDYLTEKLGDRVKFDNQNAQGDSVNCATIVNQFVSNGDDLILANATQPLAAAASATTDIPILGTSVTDYGVALAIDNFDGKTGMNISGTSDLAPLEEQANMIKELFPDAKKVGLLSCSGEPNSKYQVEKVSEALEKLGYECKSYTFVDSNDVASVTQNACDNSDVLYIPTDNVAASNTEVIKNICIPAKRPIVTGEEGPCKGCGVATLSISYYELGQKTGEMAYKVLVEGKDISQMDIEYAPNVTKKYNKAICEELGVKIPEGYVAIEE